MIKKNQKALYTEKQNIGKIIEFFNKYGNIYNATIQLPEGKKAIIQPYNAMLEIISDDVEKINELEKILTKDDRTTNNS